jgi:hypothetical protein
MPSSARSLSARVRRVPARACRPTASGFACRKNAAPADIVLHTRVGTPNPTRRRRPAQHFSRDHDGMLRTAAARPARSRRNADQVWARGGFDLLDRWRLRKRHTRRRWKSGEAKIPRRVPPSAFEWPRSSSKASCRLAHVVTSQLLRAARATGERRGGRFPPFDGAQGAPSVVEGRRAAPAAASR